MMRCQPPSDDTTSLLEDLFPAQVSCVFSARPPEKFALLASEAAAATTMREPRLREFAHGRACARAALARLGIVDCPIPVGENRAPLWPAEIVGSISHAGNAASAVVAKTSDLQALGIDLEIREPLDPPLIKMLCRPEELIWLNRSTAADGFAKIIFSAKESLFKCVWPTLRRFIDFQDIEIRLESDFGRFTAIAHSEEIPGDLIGQVQGRYTQTDALIITGAYIER